MKENKNWKYYFVDGTVSNYHVSGAKLHRKDGPAIESPGHDLTHWEYSINGKLHNINGPAYCTSIGTLYYYINDRCIGCNLSNQEFKQKIKEFIFQ